MFSEFKTPNKKYCLKTDKYICNKFGLAEFFARHYKKFMHKDRISILDAGCGAMPLGIFLADQFNCSVVGVELNPRACMCAEDNIKKLKLENSITLYDCNFVDFLEKYDGELFDCIVANPPIDDSVTYEEILKHKDNSYENLNDKTFSFLTNSWHALSGKDLTDYIFEFGLKHLKLDGSILLVFCMIDCNSPDYVYNKAERYGYHMVSVFEDYISAESIGAETLGIDLVSTFMTEFRR